MLLGKAMRGLDWNFEVRLRAEIILASQVHQMAQFCQGQRQPAKGWV